MEFWPVKIDWNAFRQHYKDGREQAWILALECNGACDTGSLNVALADVFPLMHPFLSEETKKAIGPLISAICSCEIEHWPSPNDNPSDWHDVEHESIGLIYSPETVKGIVTAFEAVSFRAYGGRDRAGVEKNEQGSRRLPTIGAALFRQCRGVPGIPVRLAQGI